MTRVLTELMAMLLSWLHENAKYEKFAWPRNAYSVYPYDACRPTIVYCLGGRHSHKSMNLFPLLSIGQSGKLVKPAFRGNWILSYRIGGASACILADGYAQKVVRKVSEGASLNL